MARHKTNPCPPAEDSPLSAGGLHVAPPPGSSGCLYIVSTPIGNPEDISLRAIKILRTVALIAAEDPRVTGRLLKHYQIETQVVSCRPRSQQDILPSLLETLASGQDIALVSDAGTPVLADPGHSLIRSALSRQIRIVPIPGASALLAALVASGLVSGRFVFEGFPPRARSDRERFFSELCREPRAILLYESRRYLRSTLQSLLQALGPERPIALACNLTRTSETIFYGTLQNACALSRSSLPAGEFVLVVGSN